MHAHATTESTPGAVEQPSDHVSDHLGELLELIEHCAHLLPSQGPITTFVHHNTLHSLEENRFDEAVLRGKTVYGCQPYLSEQHYRDLLRSGRIRDTDLVAVLLEDLDDDAQRFIGLLGTRYHLRSAMLQYPLRSGEDAQLRWLIDETDALVRFPAEAPADVRRRMLADTRRWVMSAAVESSPREPVRGQEMMSDLLGQFGRRRIEHWSDADWESFTLHLLWRVCHQGVHGVPRFGPAPTPSIRHRDALLQSSGVDIDQVVNEVLIRFCAAFLDQGYAHWSLPQREQGFFKAFAALYGDSRPVDRWMRRLPSELARAEQEGFSPLESIADSLDALGVTPAEREEFISQTLLALRGWAGMIWQMETNAEWAVHPAPIGTLTEFLAVRLLLERSALEYSGSQFLGERVELRELRTVLRRRVPHTPRVSVEQRAFLVFQLARMRGWTPAELHSLTKSEWSQLVEEIEAFPSVERRRIYHLAYERRYRNQTLDAIAAHDRYHGPTVDRPSFQAVCCIDDREESFRRHMEEIDPRCQTYGAAGFYAVAMYYRGASDAHYRPLCPVIIKPRHYVREEAAYSLAASSRTRSQTRRMLGQVTHRWHLGSRTFLGGIVTALLGSLASIPMVTRILLPRLTAQVNRLLNSFLLPPPVTELMIARLEDPPGPEEAHLGYSQEEMAGVVERVLRETGMTANFSRLVIMIGHGSGSLNNPHESAYNCGACSGGRGGPNARAFAQMANMPKIREMLRERSLEIPDETVFVGAYHNTCDEDVVYFDLDRVPRGHRADFEAARQVIDRARERNAHERCRRFLSAELSMSPEEALQHVEARAEDLSEARPEYNHATNALCIVGRRERTRGLFLDRRAFVTSYDPTQDDEEATILARILSAAVPVCAGISLEYYFSCVDAVGYGCGSKLPHNVVSLLGVMEGAASDLRTGLSQQMIEIHEPLRILFIIETTPEKMMSIIGRNPTIERLVCNEWVQLATLDPHSAALQLFQHGRFEEYSPETTDLPHVASSGQWYRGRRDHLGFASIEADASPQSTAAQEAA
ncbi:MAG: DUF2309 domain-containing protein [Pirellulaceae bacterium]